MVALTDGRRATASIYLRKLPASRRVYAYLRHSERGKTYDRYVGDVTFESREEALRAAWKKARGGGLLDDPRYRSRR